MKTNVIRTLGEVLIIAWLISRAILDKASLSIIERRLQTVETNVAGFDKVISRAEQTLDRIERGIAERGWMPANGLPPHYYWRPGLVVTNNGLGQWSACPITP